MKIFIRTDSSLEIGCGHVMRCLTLADELRQRGVNITFICREHTGNLIGLIVSKGYSVVRLHQSETKYVTKDDDLVHAAWLGVSWQQDSKDTLVAIGEISADWLIIDHYAIDSRWEDKLRPHVGKVMVIDDLADRPHNCELLLDQNLYQTTGVRYNNLIPKACQKLLGPKYVLLRPEFTEVRKHLRPRSGEIKRVFVFFGGVDQTNETEKALLALTCIKDRHFCVDVVLGQGNIHKERIQDFCSVHDRFNCYCQVDNIAELMAAADLAIGAGGTATWERCAMGVPSIAISVADNQLELLETGAYSGLFFYLGKSSNTSTEKLLNVLEVFICSPENLHSYSMSGLALIDAKGVQRVAGFICPPNILIRPARLEDCDDIYKWRNDEETRRYIFDTESFSLEIHKHWYLKALENPSRILLVGEVNNRPVGVLRYDLSNNEALVSVYLVPGNQGQGIGSQLISSGTLWIQKNLPNIRILNAAIFPENIASQRAFESANYKLHHSIYKEVL